MAMSRTGVLSTAELELVEVVEALASPVEVEVDPYGVDGEEGGPGEGFGAGEGRHPPPNQTHRGHGPG